MRFLQSRLSRLGGAAVMGIAAAVALMVARPSRGQQPQPQPPPDAPAIQTTIPASPGRFGFTRVDYEFTLPAGYSLVRNPRLRAVDAAGNVIELLPMYVRQRRPSYKGHRSLHTETYAPGSYRVSIVVTYRRPDGVEQTVATPERPLTVPARAPEAAP